MVTLRAFSMDDIPQLVSILNDSDVTRYLSTKIPMPYTELDAKWWVEEGCQQGLVRALVVNNKCVGCIGVMPGEFEYSRSGEIGYWLAKSAWRQGFMAEAIEQLCCEVFDTTDIVRIHAAVFSGNVASMRLLEKCGFSQEAVLKRAIVKADVFYDKFVYALLKKDE
ncbi:N-acetyltransferase [Alteromonas sp. KC3]|uniref:GNAT family N-acetyltransferase n=1 Tax=unclassified Alteromonas TaxID=2614992 RepID=UPI0019235668|nr:MULTISPECIES: GNAT family protein [unclassified Alteromonas]BCO19491.1 N-acetyltransferase [Alteromonas sp. KC3]BCO23456.1 N-acetyltransferase [Alteromonas sp. KC14]